MIGAVTSLVGTSDIFRWRESVLISAMLPVGRSATEAQARPYMSTLSIDAIWVHNIIMFTAMACDICRQHSYTAVFLIEVMATAISPGVPLTKVDCVDKRDDD